jgi:predicted acetyltransferase
MDLTIESVRDGDGERFHGLMRQAFGGTMAYDPDEPRLDPDQTVCSYLGGDLVGSMITLDFDQTWGGRPVPCGGVSGVTVVPEARGRGAARRMLEESFRRMAERRQAVSALYPTTATLYRSMGYEVAGWYRRRSLPLATVSSTSDALQWRRAALDDPAGPALHDAMSLHHDGWFRGDADWFEFRVRRAVRDTSVNRYLYVGSRGGTDVAAVQYKYRSSGGDFYDLEVELLAGIDGEAVGAALGLLAGHGTTAGAIDTALPASLLQPHVPHIQRATVRSDWPFMLRLIDAPAAIQARGWPRSVRGRIDLAVDDPVLPANAGPHVLEVDSGQATLLRGGSGKVSVTAQDLAALYAGSDVQALRSAGRLAEADADELDLLAAAFVSSPTITMFF